MELQKIFFCLSLICSAFVFSGSWEDFQLDTDLSGAMKQSCCINESGEILVTWYSNSFVKVAVYNGSEWLKESLDESSTSIDTDFVISSISDSGKAVVSWTDGSFVKTAVYSDSNWTLMTHSSESACGYVTNSMNESGSAVISWYENDGSNYYVKASIYDGSGWTAKTFDDAVAVGEITNSINKSGEVVVSWVENDGTNYYAKASFYDGTNWSSSPEDLSGAKDLLSTVTNSISDSGTAMVSWIDYEGSAYSVKASIYKGGSWTLESLGSYTTECGFVTNAMNAAGQAVVSWYGYESKVSVSAAIYDGSKWKTTELSSELSKVNQLINAINDSGLAIVSWKESVDSSYNVKTAIYESSAWTIKVLGDELTFCSLWNNSINALGQAIVVWYEEIDSRVVKVAIYDGSSWEITQLDSSSGNINNCCGVINDSGLAVVSWQVDDDEYCAHTKVAMYDGGSWSTNTELGDNDESQSGLSLALNNFNRAVVSWLKVGSDYDMWAAIYDFESIVLGGESFTTDLLFQRDITDKIYWNSISNVSCYKVYDDNLNLLYEGEETHFYVHGAKKAERLYYVSWISSGKESGLFPITVK